MEPIKITNIKYKRSLPQNHSEGAPASITSFPVRASQPVLVLNHSVLSPNQKQIYYVPAPRAGTIMLPAVNKAVFPYACSICDILLPGAILEAV